MKYSFDEFRTYVTDEVIRNLGKDGARYQASEHSNVKLNHFGGPAVSFSREGELVGSVWYPEKSYEEYRNGRSMNSIIESVSKNARVKLEDTLGMEGKGLLHAMMAHDWKGIRRNVRLVAVGYERNKERLDEYPHIRQGDICGVCKIAIPMTDSDSIGYVTINHDHLRSMGIDQDTMFETAKENCQREEPASCKNLQEVLNEMTGGIFQDDEPDRNDPGLMPVYVLTNRSRQNGAAVMFYDGVMEKVQEEFPQGFYILPSSVHELMIVPKNMGDAESLEEMVQMVNANEVAPEEVLSDHVHTYDPVRKRVVCNSMEPVQEREKQQERLENIL